MAYTPPKSPVRDMQIRAWGYYGSYGAIAQSQAGTTTYGKLPQRQEAVGEVRYVVGWAADQMSRMKWDILVDGSRYWEIELPDKTVVKSLPPSKSKKNESETISPSARVLQSIGWTNSTVRSVTTNLYVAGELFYTFIDKSWRVLSVIHPDQKKIFDRAAHVVRGLWPSPVDPDLPDAPLFGVLSILEDMDWLSRLSRSQSANRVGMRGILGSADGLEFMKGGNFWDEWDESLRRKMEDPTDVGPVHLRGAPELVEPVASGRGLRGLGWLVPDFPYDARIEGRMESLIHRLSYGLPIPPEILLGLQAQSRATAFQVEENSYRAHIEPPAQIIAQVASDVLNTLFENMNIEVVPDPSLLLAKRHTTEDVKDAHDRGVVSDEYLRTVLGIPEDAAPSDEEKRMRLSTKDPREGGHSPTTETPKERAARADREDPSKSPNENSVDEITLATWRGRIDAAVFRAHDRLGAKARTHKALREALPENLPNDQVPTYLGVETLESAGLDVASIISDSLLFLGPSSVAGDNFVDALTESVLEELGEEVYIGLSDSKLAELLQGLAIQKG